MIMRLTLRASRAFERVVTSIDERNITFISKSFCNKFDFSNCLIDESEEKLDHELFDFVNSSSSLLRN